jgi:hypothetical protein
MTMWLLPAIMAVFGILYCVFAVVRPPSFVGSFFKVPSLFMVLPDRLVVPVGRMAIGVLILVGAIIFAIKFAMAGVL